jgi:hypothetical protein
LKGFDEVVGIVLADVLDAKVVNNEAEGDVAALVTPEAGGLGRGGVAVFGKVDGEANIGNEGALFEAVHALANFHVHPPAGGGKGLQRVLLHDFVGNDAEGKLHVFLPFYWRVEVEILNVGDHEAGVRGGDRTASETNSTCKLTVLRL